MFALGCRLNFCYFINSIFLPSSRHLIRSICNTSDKSSPRAYEQVLASGHRLPNFSSNYVLLQLSKFSLTIFCSVSRSFLQLYFAPSLEVFSNYILLRLSKFFQYDDVVADENHVWPPWEDTTAGEPLFCGSKTTARPPIFPTRAQ